MDVLVAAVEASGGEVSLRLPLINGVGALLTETQFQALQQRTEIHSIFADSGADSSGHHKSKKHKPKKHKKTQEASWQT